MAGEGHKEMSFKIAVTIKISGLARIEQMEEDMRDCAHDFLNEIYDVTELTVKATGERRL